MPHDTPHHPDFASTLELPPVPFARAATAAVADELPPVAPQAGLAVVVDAPASVGTSISELLDALKLDGITMDADEVRPHAEFSAAVERRGRTERRGEPRVTPDRRAFASTNLAMPDDGPEDPRPQGLPPVEHVLESPSPIDPIMPELPIALEPARHYELPSRGLATGTLRTTRANVHVNELPFPATAMAHPVPPAGAPEPPTAPPVVEQQIVQDPIAHLQPAPAHAAPLVGIDGIFASSAPIPVGRLEPFGPGVAAYVPQTGPAGPAQAPGAGLDPVVAAVAATPTAWNGNAVHVDDAMLVWNAPGSNAPLAPSVAAMISTPPPSATSPSAPATTTAGIATTALTPADGATAAIAGARATRGPLASLLRLLLMIGIPAASGTGLAVALDRFLL